MENFRLVHTTRAYDNSCYVGVCNTVGQAAAHLADVEANHAGGCLAVDPGGTIMSQSRTGDIREQMLLVDMPAAPLESLRQRRCHPFQTRRPEVFAAITRKTD